MKNFFNKNLTVFKGLAAVVAATLAIGSAYKIVRSPKNSDPTLTVGMMSGWAPFMTINSQGVFEGFDVDVAEELAQRMGKKLVIKDLGSLASCFIALAQGKVDLLFSGLDITKKRLKTFAMVRYTGQDVTHFNLVFWNTIPKNIKTIQDLQSLPGAVVAVESGSEQETFLNQFEYITKKRLPSVTDSVLDLKFGKYVATLLEPAVAARLRRLNPEIKVLKVPLTDNFQVYGCGIALKQENSALTAEVTSLIEDMRRNGTLKKLEQKWQREE
ncbi:amino acid ABC transporter substrate-binding protein [Candidatus Dependentiae bacterium]|nr:amino acid ABC transporter substrate-binding protein [Candidatus Dependentiae bacterium]